jgi:lariat debranching enzyme
LIGYLQLIYTHPVQGHGTLNAIYAAVEESCKARSWDGVDLLIIGGDFQASYESDLGLVLHTDKDQAVRNAADLTVMSCPPKYRELGDFHQYYSGEKLAPYLTIFIAGNHEAAAHLWELYYGGWVAPNIYYMGAANVLRFGPIRIAGLSGIWKGFDYRKSHHERLPFSQDDVKSFYHVREIDVRKLLQIRTQVDVGLSHDWPRGVEHHGNERHLFNMKPDFEAESRDGSLGSIAAEYVMDRLRPPYWFSAHMHCKFSALKRYPDTPSPVVIRNPRDDAVEASAASSLMVVDQNPDEIDLDDDENQGGETGVQEVNGNGEQTDESKNGVSDELRAQLPASFTITTRNAVQSAPSLPFPPGISNREVRFLALDKCLPRRNFLQLLEIQPFGAEALEQFPAHEDGGPRFKLQYDPEWLAITRVFSNLIAVGRRNVPNPPDLGESQYLPMIEAERVWVEENIVAKGRLDVPNNFEVTAPPHVPGDPESVPDQPKEYTNPQIVAFCELVGLENHWNATEEERAERQREGPARSYFHNVNRGGRGRGGYGGGRGFGGGRGHGRGRGSRGRGYGRGRAS